MQAKKYNSLGVSVLLSVPSSIEEYDQLAKRVNATLDDAIDNVVYRSALADFRESFCAEVEKETGIARKRETVLDKDNNPKKDESGNTVTKYSETEGDYLKRVCSEKNYDDAGPFQALADVVASTITFDPSVREKKEGSAKVAKTYLEAADKIIGMGAEAVDRARTKLANYLGRELASIGADRDSIGAAIKAKQDKQRQEEINALTA
jgi:hypothetical protein